MRKNLVFLALLCAIIVVFSGAVSAADVPSANFTSNVTNGSAPLSVQFNDTSAGNVTSWSWDFGDGSNSTDENPVHNYTKAGTYSVSLTAGNDAGNNTVTQTNYITVLLNDAYVSTAGSDTTGDGTSTSPYATLQKALNNVATGGTIHLASGTYTGTGNYGLTTNNDVNIVGDDQNSTIINAASAGSIFTVNSGVTVTLANLTLANGTATYAGAIYNTGILTVTNCTFTSNGNSINQDGGAIYNEGTITSLSGCTFTGNTAASNGYGGAIYNRGTITSLSGCTFTGNTASGYGGAIYTNTPLSISGCIFTGNTANYGGAICNKAKPLTVNNCTFASNTASNYGGAIYNYLSSYIVNVSNSTFTGNKANSQGGAIWNGGTLNVHFSSFVNNTAQFGNAIFRAYGAVNAEDNWWGSNSDPSSQVSGTVDCSNWLYMMETVVPGTVANGSKGNVTVSFNNVWNGTTVTSVDPANGTIPDGTVVNFTSGLGSFSPVTATTVGGIATTNFTATTLGNGTVNATADNQTVSSDVTVNLASSIVAGNVTALSGDMVNLTVTLTDGTGTGLSGENVTFTVNGTSYTATTDSNGLATVTVTAPSAAGVYNVTASFGGDSAYQASSNNGTNYLTVQLRDAYVSPTGSDTSGDGTESNPYATIQNALNNTVTGGTVHVRSGTYTGTGNYGITLSRNVTIVGDDQASTIINAASAGNIFTINSGLNVTIANLTFANGNSTTYGGAIYNNGALNVSNCTFIGNTATPAGGAICNRGIINSIDGCNFTCNAVTSTSTSSGGGAIFNWGNITSVSGCTFVNNTAITQGGAIFNRGSITSVSACTFTSNNAASMGGSIYNYRINSVIGVITSVSGCTFTNNTATKRGGAIYNGGTINLIDNSTFTGNKATDSTGANGGGAIYNAGTMTSVSECTFTSNTAARGGAIMHYGSYTPYTTMNVHYCSFVNNVATISGWGDAIAGYNGIVNATYNWWGSNNSPASQVLATSQPPGTVYYSNWLVMTVTVDPATVGNGSTANVTVSFNNVWNGTGVSNIDPASGHISDGTVVNFSSLLGSFAPVSVNTTNGTATATFTANTTDIGVVNATADNQTVSGSVTVYDVPVAGFSANPTNGTNPLTVQFTDASSNVPSSWSWNFGDGSTSNEQNPVHTYSKAGNYTVTLTVGNAAGNNTATQANCVIVSQDTTAPVVLNVTPTSGAGDLPVNQVITVTFSEPISAGAAYDRIKVITPDNKAKVISKTISGSTLTIVSAYSYNYGDTYKLVIPVGAVTDLAGNNLTNVYNSNFTIGTIPTVTSVDPVDKAGNVSTTKTITVTFSNNVTAGAAYDKIKVITPSGQAKVISKTLTGNTLTITTAYSYTPGTYTIYIPVNAVVDVAGNSLKTAYNSTFTVSSGPTVNNVNTTDLSTNKTITVTFDGNIAAGANFSKIKVITLDNKAKLATVTIRGNQLVITAAYNYTPGSYTLSIPANSLTDSNGNAIAENYTKTITA